MQMELDFGRSERSLQNIDTALREVEIADVPRAVMLLVFGHQDARLADDGLQRIVISHRKAAEWISTVLKVACCQTSVRKAIQFWINLGVFFVADRRSGTEINTHKGRLQDWYDAETERMENRPFFLPIKTTADIASAQPVNTPEHPRTPVNTPEHPRTPVNTPEHPRTPVNTPIIIDYSLSKSLNNDNKSNADAPRSERVVLPRDVPPIPLAIIEPPNADGVGAQYRRLTEWSDAHDLPGRWGESYDLFFGALAGVIRAAGRQTKTPRRTYITRCLNQGVFTNIAEAGSDWLAREAREETQRRDWEERRTKDAPRSSPRDATPIPSPLPVQRVCRESLESLYGPKIDAMSDDEVIEFASSRSPGLDRHIRSFGRNSRLVRMTLLDLASTSDQ